MEKGSPCLKCRYANVEFHMCEGWLVDCRNPRCPRHGDLPFNPDLVDKCPFFKPAEEE